MSKNFKNTFGIKSSSPHLLQAFVEECKKLGWTQQDWNTGCPDLYFQGNDSPEKDLKYNCFWRSNADTNFYNLPQDWDIALKIASELVEEKKQVSPKKPSLPKRLPIGTYVEVLHTGGFFTTHPELVTEYSNYKCGETPNSICKIVDYISISNCKTVVILEDVDGNIYGADYTTVEYRKALKRVSKEKLKEIRPKKFQVGDKVVVYTLNSKKGTMGGVVGHIGTITDISRSGFYTLYPYCVGKNWPADCLRYATPSEAKTLDDVVSVKFSDTMFTVLAHKDVAESDRGELTRKDIENVVELFYPKIEICGYPLQIEDIDNIKISFGCQTDTVGKAKEILNAFGGN